MIWKDVTGYSQSDTVRTPRNFELKTKYLRINVHRHINWPKDVWLLSCHQLGMECREMKEVSIERAQVEAIEHIKHALNAYLKDLK
jgi:hypothetical protein